MTHPGESRRESLGAAAAVNAAEALELATNIARLSHAGLPLADGLRAMAQDLPPGRLVASTRALAERLDAGESLEVALGGLSLRLPKHLGNLVIAGARSGRLAETLDEILAHKRDVDALTRTLWQAIAYPALLFTFFVGWLLFTTWWIIPGVGEIATDSLDDFNVFNRSEPSALRSHAQRIVEFGRVTPRWILGAGCAALAAVTVAWLMGRGAMVSRLVAQIPLIGPAWRFQGLTDFTGLLALFLEQRLPLGESLEMVSLAARDPAMAAAARGAAHDVALGRELAPSLADQHVFPPTLMQLVDWGQRHAALPESLRAARAMAAERFSLQVRLIRWVFPSLVFFAIVSVVVFVVAGLYAEMLNWIASLTWNWPTPVAATPSHVSAFIELSGLASIVVLGLSLLGIAQILRTMVVEADASRRLLRYTGLVLLAIGLLGFCVMLPITVTIGTHEVSMAIVPWLIGMIAWWRAARQVRRAQQQALFSALVVAAENHMPLAPMVLAFAAEQADGFAVRAGSLARRLNDGASLGDAVAQARGVLPPEAPLAVRLGEESGDLASSLRATLFDGAFDRTLIPAIVLRMLYVVPAMLLFVAYMNLKIAPSMAMIFRDFDISLPAISVAAISSPALKASNVIATIILVVLATALFWILAWLQWRGTLVPRLPVVKRIANWIDGGSVLRVLALAARKRLPLPKVFWAVARLHPKRSVRYRMGRAAQQVDDGRPWPECLRRQRLLGGRDVAALSAAERNGNLDWALAQMAESFERRANYRLQAILESAVPLAIVPIGLVVGVMAVAYFAPLVKLIWELSF